MKTARIESISRIEKNSNGDIINLVVINLTNHKPLVRSLKLFVVDLENSGRLAVPAASIVSVKQPSFVNACTHLRLGTVTGEFKEHKAGEKWAITEGHPALTDATHPLFPKQIGDKVAYEKDGTDIAPSTFLTLSVSREREEIEAISAAIVESRNNNSMGSYTFGNSGNGSDDDDDAARKAEDAARKLAEEFLKESTPGKKPAATATAE